MAINIVKLCVGIDSVAHFEAHRAAQRKRGIIGPTRHVTRMWPRREKELLDGGSLYWVIKGVIQARQSILRLEEVIGNDGIRRCGIIMAPEIIRTEAAVRRPFQGWRYMERADSPADLAIGVAGQDDLPPELMTALAEIGVR